MKTTTKLTLGTTALTASVLIASSSRAIGQSSNSPDVPVKLQAATPGVPQSGSANITGHLIAKYFKGSGAFLKDLNATELTKGTIAENRLPAVVARLQAAAPGTAQTGNMNISGTFMAGFFKGDGSGVTGVNAANVTSGTLNDARLSTNIPRLSGSNTFNGTQIFNGSAYVFGSTFAMGKTTVNTDSRVLLLRSIDDFGQLILKGQNGKDNVVLSSLGGSPNNGWMGVRDLNGVTQAKMYVDTDGNGVVAADVKNFVVPNPRNPQQDIVYACVEGPEAAAYVRGVGHLVNGKAHVALPDHFTSVTINEGVTIQITPKSPTSEGLAYFNDTNSGFDVAELHSGKGNYDFAWEAKAVRRKHEDYRPVRQWDETLPESKDKAKEWNARLESIQAREAAYTARRAARP